MADLNMPSATPGAAGGGVVSIFQSQWLTYRKMVDNNYLFHDEAYGCLRAILQTEAARPFSFFDVACGDASSSVQALRGTPIGDYHGIDASQSALALARVSLQVSLACPAYLEQRDLVDALRERRTTHDVAWIGLSLHHFEQHRKLAVLRDIRRIIPQGMLLIYENTSPDGESREAWMSRWDAQRPTWTAYTDEEWEAMASHVHDEDHPETDATWRRLGEEAGFETVRERYRAPTDLFRLYSFE